MISKKISKYTKKFFISFYFTFKRFPLATIFSFILFINFSVVIIKDNFSKDYILFKTLFIFTFAILLSLIFNILVERYEKIKKKYYLIYYSASIIFLTFFYFFILNSYEIIIFIEFALISLILLIIFLILPYFPAKDNFAFYVKKLFIDFIISILYACVLYIGIIITFFTITELLEIKLNSNYYEISWVFCIVIVAFNNFLINIPKKNHLINPRKYNIVLKMLLIYIIVPLIYIYTLILYIYFFKALITKWPNGIVSHLIIWYGIIVFITLILLKPIKNNKWINSFIFIMPKIILPLFVTLFYSMGIRIYNYGYTESRYYIIISGIILISIFIYWNIPKFKNNIVAFLIIIFFILPTLTGPFSFKHICIRSQKTILEDILTKNDMLNNNIITPNSNITDKEKTRIVSILSYFNKTYSFSELDFLPENFDLINMETVFGFDNTEYSYFNDNYISYYKSNTSNDILEINNIKGYDYLININEYDSYNSSKNSDFYYEFIENSDTIILKKDNTILINESLADILKTLYKTPSFDEDIDIEGENPNAKYKIKINSLSFIKQSTESNMFNKESIDITILIKLK
jgi:hypothetical protein